MSLRDKIDMKKAAMKIAAAKKLKKKVSKGTSLADSITNALRKKKMTNEKNK